MNFFGTGVRFSRRAISWRSLSGSRFENSETAHSSVKYQKTEKSLSNTLITALETVLLCHVSCNHLNHATTAASGHCKEQKMSSATFPRTTWHNSGTGTPVCLSPSLSPKGNIFADYRAWCVAPG